MFDLVVSISAGGVSFKKGKNRNLWNRIVGYGVESLDKEDISTESGK